MHARSHARPAGAGRVRQRARRAARRLRPYALSATDAAGHMRKFEDLESEIIRMAIARYDGHMSEVARRLGIGRSTLYRKLKEFGLEPDVATKPSAGARTISDEAQSGSAALAAALKPHPQRLQIQIEHRFLFLEVGLVEFPHPHHLAHDLGVEAGALGLGIDFADIGGQRRALLLQPLDAVDEGFEMFFGEAGFGHGRCSQISEGRGP